MKITIKNLSAFKQIKKFKKAEEFDYRGERKQFECTQYNLLQVCNDMECDRRVAEYKIDIDRGYQDAISYVITVRYYC